MADLEPIKLLKTSYLESIPKGTRDPIMRSLKILNLFARKSSGVTIPDIAAELNVHKDTARYWLFRLSLALPVYESGIDENYDGCGRPAVKYSLLKGD